jgi:hypothetical protein
MPTTANCRPNKTSTQQETKKIEMSSHVTDTHDNRSDAVIALSAGSVHSEDTRVGLYTVPRRSLDDGRVYDLLNDVTS